MSRKPKYLPVYAVIDPWTDRPEAEPVLLTLDWAHAARRRDRMNAVRSVRAYEGRDDLQLRIGDRVYCEEWSVTR